MFQALYLFAKQILTVGGFRVGQIQRSVYTNLLTALQSLIEQPVVIISSLIELAKQMPGRLVVDDTSNPKYGLKNFSRKLKIPATNGFVKGFKIVLFLWESQGTRLPLGFALWHQGTPSLNELCLEGLSRIRNHFQLKPSVVLFDAAYMTDKTAKRLQDYGWPFVSRFKKNRKLSNQRIRAAIPRGYGTSEGHLSNGVKVKVLRRKHFFVVCNRMTWSSEKILATYKIRWKIEETFRVLKTCLNLQGCQQHSIRAQALYLFVCLLLFSGVELYSDVSHYSTFQAVILGQFDLQNVLTEKLFDLW